MKHLEHSGSSQAKKVNLKGGPTFPEWPPECWNCATCSEIEVEKGLKSILNPPLLQK